MKKFLGTFASSLIITVPVFVFAQAGATPQSGYITNLIGAASTIVSILLPFLVAIAVLAFFYGLAKFIFSAGDENARKEARQIMVWGVIAIAIMISVYGLVLLLQSIFGISGNQDLTGRVPLAPTRGGSPSGFTSPVDGLGWE